MADYKAIKGFTIQTTSSEPSNPVLGQMWYNSSLGKVRVGKTQAASWSTGGDLNQTRYALGGAGNKTAALGFGGYDPPVYQAVTESYDGTAWTEVGDLATARNKGAGFGTQTAAIYAGGSVPITAVVEEWNGAGWSEATALPVTGITLNFGGSGTTTAGLVEGGGHAPANTDASFEWNGASWTEGGDMNLTRGGNTSTGTQTATLTMGGSYVPPPGVAPTADVEDYNGVAWTEVADMTVSRGFGGTAGTPSQAIIFGGETGPDPSGVANSDVYDGSTWAVGAPLPAAANNIGSGGISTRGAGIGFGGNKTSVELKATYVYEDESVVGGSVTTS